MFHVRQDSKSRSSRKVAFASMVGTAIEWYDFYLFGTAAALIFNKLFFPHFTPLIGTLSSFATLAVGFFARPIGAIIFGHFGDKIGRKEMLITTLIMMGTSTFLIGCLPTYEKIGILAPILLVILRIFQGVAVGGEWGGAIVLAAEHSRDKERGFYASWPNSGAPIGLSLAIIAFIAFSSMPETQFMTWGWRIPFLLGAALFVIGLFIRLRIYESPIFLEVRRKSTMPGIEMIRTNPKNFILATGERFAESSSYYIFTVYILNYATEQLHLSKDIILYAVLVASLIESFTIPFFGKLSDKIGRRPVYFLGGISLSLFAFPFFWLVNTKITSLIFLALMVGLAICHAAMHGPQPAFYSEFFKTRFRYSGTAIAYHISAALSGGMAPLIATTLVAWTGGNPWPVSIYLILMVVVTITSVYFATELSQKNISA